MSTYLKTIAVWLSLVVFSGAALADEHPRVVLHISDLEAIYAVHESIDYLKAHEKPVMVAVVVTGHAVLALSKQRFLAGELISRVEWIGACSKALAQNHQTRNDLAEGVHYISEGVHYISEGGLAALTKFQHEGYAYIKI